MYRLFLALTLAAYCLTATFAFTTPSRQLTSSTRTLSPKQFAISMSSKEEEVLELADDEEVVVEKEEKAVAPFLSQGEISEESMDLSDPKQARVMFYIILSLIPVLFLIPLMLGSRDLVPLDMLPPVEIQ